MVCTPVVTVPVVYMRNPLPRPGWSVDTKFERACSIRPIHAAALYGRRVLLARQTDDDIVRPTVDDIRPAGLLAELGEIERSGRALSVEVHARQLARIIGVRPDAYDDGVAEADLELDDSVSEQQIGGFADGGRRTPPISTPHDLLREYIVTGLANDLAAIPERAATELTLQFHVHAAIERWLTNTGYRVHCVVKQNASTGNRGEFSDLLIEHPSGHIAFELKKNDHAENLLADMRKLKGYVRSRAVRTGVLLCVGKRGVPVELLRSFTFDCSLRLLYLGR